jgi:hypothetical protein
MTMIRALSEESQVKEAAVEVLQLRMDKCTTEQFWVVATLSGINAFAITQKRDLGSVPPWVIIAAIVTATFYGIYFILTRHLAYYRYRAQQVELFQNEPGIPAGMKQSLHPWKGQALSGVVFYSVLLLAVAALTIYLFR